MFGNKRFLVNLMDHNYSDFTISAYRELATKASEKFTSVSFCTFQNSPDTRKLLWRHDVDFSLNRSLDIARIDAEIGLQATFFIRLRSEFYNALENSQTKIIDNILSLGHEIGLHFESRYDAPILDKSELEERIEKDSQILKFETGISVTSFSFHNPTPEILEYKDDRYAGLVNAYSRSIMNEFDYVSDSNGFWRFQRLDDVLSKPTGNLQVLTHPGWWHAEELSPYQRIVRMLDGRRNATLKGYERQLAEDGRINLGGDRS
jgi:hypothetical protein